VAALTDQGNPDSEDEVPWLGYWAAPRPRIRPAKDVAERYRPVARARRLRKMSSFVTDYLLVSRDELAG